MSKTVLSGYPSPLTDRASQARSGRGLVAEFMTFWREFVRTAFFTYYPERHYMRGPGPACAAKRKSSAP